MFANGVTVRFANGDRVQLTDTFAPERLSLSDPPTLGTVIDDSGEFPRVRWDNGFEASLTREVLVKSDNVG